jgi:hypothetical protein
MSSFANAGTFAARFLILRAPAMDQYFEEPHELWPANEPPPRGDGNQLMRRHGMVPEA